MITILGCFFIFAGTATIAFLFRRAEDRRYNKQFTLENRLFQARDKRRAWLLKNPFARLSVDENYEELWRNEIGAEALLVMAFPHLEETSFEEYRTEHRQLEAEAAE